MENWPVTRMAVVSAGLVLAASCLWLEWNLIAAARLYVRLRDEIRSLEASELGLPTDMQVAAPKGRATEGKPGTRKMRYGKVQKKFGR